MGCPGGKINLAAVLVKRPITKNGCKILTETTTEKNCESLEPLSD